MSTGLGPAPDARRPVPPASTFLRGLTVGALVGAAIAGTLLVGRRRRAGVRQPRPAVPPPSDASA